MRLFEVACQPANDNVRIKNTIVYSNFYYESFGTLEDALNFCSENCSGESRYLNMRIEEQLFDDEDCPHRVINTHNPYELLGIIEEVTA